MEPFDPGRFRPGMTLEELMPDEDRRAYAVERLDAVVKYADDLYPLHVAPKSERPRPRYLDVLQEMSRGCDMAEAGRRLGIGTETVMSHTKKARRALDARNTAHAIAEALRQGLIE